MKQLLLFFCLFSVISQSLFAQIPVTIHRSTVNTGGSVVLPSFTADTTEEWGIDASMSFESAECFGAIDNHWASIGGTASTAPFSFARPVSIASVTTVANPIVTIARNSPSSFTNSVSAHGIYSGGGLSRTTTDISQSYAVTIIEDQRADGTSIPSSTITGQSDVLENLSRKDNSNPLRKLIGFSITATTSSTLRSIAFFLSNTGTIENPFSNLSLYRDADGRNSFDQEDILVATTTNGNNFAIFTNLSETIGNAPVTYFLAASFRPSEQPRYSFLSASLNSQNVIVTDHPTNSPILVNGGNLTGKQYSFLDANSAEELATATAISGQISSAVNEAADRFHSSSLTSQKQGFTDSVLPAAAAGAAAVGAAFTSDSINQTPLSKEYLHH